MTESIEEDREGPNLRRLSETKIFNPKEVPPEQLAADDKTEIIDIEMGENDKDKFMDDEIVRKLSVEPEIVIEPDPEEEPETQVLECSTSCADLKGGDKIPLKRTAPCTNFLAKLQKFFKEVKSSTRVAIIKCSNSNISFVKCGQNNVSDEHGRAACCKCGCKTLELERKDQNEENKNEDEN